MGVDGIGGPRGPLTPPTSGVQVSGVVGRADEARIGASNAAGTDAAAGASSANVGAAAGADVERVRLARGEITLEQYLDGEVVRATSHLEHKAPPAMLEVIRDALRQELASDPVLLSLASRISAG